MLPCQVTILSFFRMDYMKISKLFLYLSPQIGHCSQKGLVAGSVSFQTQPEVLDLLNHGLGPGLITYMRLFSSYRQPLPPVVLFYVQMCCERTENRGTGRNLRIISRVSLDFFLSVAKQNQILSV